MLASGIGDRLNRQAAGLFLKRFVDNFLYPQFGIPLVRHDLLERNDNQSIRWTDPIVSGSSASPAVFADVTRRVPLRIVGAHGKAESESSAIPDFFSAKASLRASGPAP